MPSFATTAEYNFFLEKIFSPYLNAPDPLIAFLRIAVEKDMPPSDAIYYWTIKGCRNSFWFKKGIKGQKDLLEILVSNKEYFEKYSKDFILFLADLSKKL
jgi:hypothetical protein